MNLNLNPAELDFSSSDNKKMKKITNLRKTLKKRRQYKEDNEKYNVNNLTSSLTGDSDDESELADFNPPPHAMIQSNQPVQAPLQHNGDEGQENQIIDNFVSRELFDNAAQASPNYNYVPYYNESSNGEQLHGRKDELLEKLNYMIHLMEEQQDEKTGHITEELILYSFLGVFMIFVVDSFARVGKYVR